MTDQVNNPNELALVPKPGETSMPPATAVTVRQRAGLIKRSLFTLTAEEMQRLDWLAQALSQSQLSYAKNGSKALSIGDLKIIMLKGLELGLEPMAALESIDLIGGKPTLDPAGMIALSQASGELEYIRFLEETDVLSVIEIKRHGQPEYRRRWSIDDAAKMRAAEWVNNVKQSIPLTQKDNWQQQPSVMLKCRNISAMFRYYMGDVIQGLYTAEELGADVLVDDSGKMIVIRANDAPPQITAPVIVEPPVPHWSTDATKVTKVYDSLIAKEYATSHEDAAALLKRAGIDLSKYETMAAMTDLPARLDAHLGGSTTSEPPTTIAEPEYEPPFGSDAAQTEPPFDPDVKKPELALVEKPAPVIQPTDELSTNMHAVCQQWLELDGIAVLKLLDKNAWADFKNRTDAEGAVKQAIVTLQLPFVCKGVSYQPLGKSGGAQTVFHAPMGAVNIVMKGGRQEMAKLISVQSAYDEFAAANGLDGWTPGGDRHALKVPLKVGWEMDGKTPKLKTLYPIFDEPFKATA